MNLFRKWRARREEVPYELEDLWPPYYISFRNPFPGGQKVLTDIYEAQVGSTVPLLTDGKGTANMVSQARAHGIKVEEVS